MKTENEVLQIIASQIQETINASPAQHDYHWIICTERIFLDDYKPKVDDYISRINAIRDGDAYDVNSLPDGYENPMDMPYQKTVFVILDMSQGEINFAVWNCPVTMKVVSEENSFDAAREMFTDFISKVNFVYRDGIIQSYFTPELSETMAEMYVGFRGVMSCKGFVRVPEPNVVFATKVMVDIGYGWQNYPFINITFDHSAQTDPQAFPGYNGATMTLNRMTTQSVSVGTYLWNGEHMDASESDDEETRKRKNANNTVIDFSKSVLGAMNRMNKVFRLAVVSNIESTDDGNIEGYMPIFSADFVLVNAHYAQDWGDLSLWSLTFSRSEEEKL